MLTKYGTVYISSYIYSYIFFHTLYYNIIFQVTHDSLPKSFILPDFARHMLPNHHPHLTLLSRVMVQFFKYKNVAK